MSQDGRWLIRWAKRNLAIRPTQGGEWNPLVSFKDFGTSQANITPDGNWLLYHYVDSAGKHSLFRVATGGGTPERLGDLPTNSQSGGMMISPDGSKILIGVWEGTANELWSLENFVPPAPKR